MAVSVPDNFFAPVESTFNAVAKPLPSTVDLIEAASMGHVDEMRDILAQGANINGQNSCGITPLMRAVMDGKTEAVRFLIDAGASLEIKDVNRRTALMLAAWRDHADIAGLLLEKGANPEEKDGAGWTALMTAAFAGAEETVKTLIHLGASLDTVDNSGLTALGVAKGRGTPTVGLLEGALADRDRRADEVRRAERRDVVTEAQVRMKRKASRPVIRA